jgi:hypothetical protein
MTIFTTKVNVRGGRRLSSHESQQSRYRLSGITPSELNRLIAEVGYDEVRKVLRALDLRIGPLIPTK